MKISFHGAARGVTGSCCLVEAGTMRVLVDCGLFQGADETTDNLVDFGFEPSRIDCVLLSHAHLDHCGRLPLLVKRGFAGRILATGATAELAEVVMLDAAHLQDEEARRAARHEASSHRGSAASLP